MSYNYNEHRNFLFTDRGNVMFLSIRDRVNRLIDTAGAVSMGAAISGESGDVWNMMACVDRMVELNEIYEVQMVGPVPGQRRLFFKPIY